MTYAKPTDIAKALRGSTSVSDEEAVQWQEWLDIVERAIERAFRRVNLVLAEQVGLGDPTEEDVRDAEVAVVIRKIQNPVWGQTSKTESHQVDDGSRSFTTRNDYPGAYVDPLKLTSADLSTLIPSGPGGAFSIRPYYDPAPAPIDWLT